MCDKYTQFAHIEGDSVVYSGKKVVLAPADSTARHEFGYETKYTWREAVQRGRRIQVDSYDLVLSIGES